MRLALDACVLFPTVLREILIAVAARGGFVPIWSARILAEWQHAAARLGPEGAQIASIEIARLRAAWPEAEIAPAPERERHLWLPDPADVHVLATALCGKADRIVTLNLRDFPARVLAAEGIVAQSPDDLLMALWLDTPARIADAVAEVQARTERHSGRAQPLRALLRRAKLPRLGKALG
ncbi:MAG: RSP_2648 family PIN domain-containing protein [Roseinatronobacter sp.]